MEQPVAEREEKEQERDSESPRQSPNVVTRRLAVLLILVGAVFALDTVFAWSVAVKLWPLLLTVLAVGLIGIYVQRGARGSMFLASGVYLLCFSVLALYCNFTSWGHLGELWPLFIAFLGAAFVAVFLAGGRRRGHLLVGLLLVSAAAVLWVEVAVSTRYWWTALILVGVSLLVWERAR